MTFLLFIFDSPIQWVVVLAAFALLFGANKLPELAKSLGQARKEFKKGMLEAEQEEQAEVKTEATPKSAESLSQLNDDEILAEIQRRQAKQLDQRTSN